MSLTSKLQGLAHIPVGLVVPWDLQEKLEKRLEWYNPRKGVIYSGLTELAVGLLYASLNPGTAPESVVFLTLDCMRMTGISSRGPDDSLVAGAEEENRRLENNLIMGNRSSLVTEIPYRIGRMIYYAARGKNAYEKQLAREINELTS